MKVRHMVSIHSTDTLWVTVLNIALQDVRAQEAERLPFEDVIRRRH